MFKKGDKPWNTGLTKEKDERIRKIAEMKIGKKHQPQTIRKISEMLKGENHPNFGKHHSLETRQRISQGRLKKDPEGISEYHEQVLIGSLLGDASLSRGNGINFYLEEAHSSNQKDYLLWKNDLLKVFNSRTWYGMFRNQGTHVNYERVRLKTKSFPFFTKLHKQFYPRGKKIIPLNVLKKLSELGLTVWFLDDGHVRVPESLVVLSTDAFIYEDNILIQKFFKEKWNICPRIGKRNGKYYYLLFNAKDSKKLLNIYKGIFEEYKIPESMFYKLGRLWEGNKEKIKNARLKKNAYKRKWRAKRRRLREKMRLKEIRSKGKVIRKLYWGDGLDSKDVGKILGYSGGGIRKIMKKLDIPVRTPSEAHSGERNGFYRKRHSIESIEKMIKNRWENRIVEK